MKIKGKIPMYPIKTCTEEELREAMEMSIPELLESGKWVRLYNWNPPIKMYEGLGIQKKENKEDD